MQLKIRGFGRLTAWTGGTGGVCCSTCPSSVFISLSPVHQQFLKVLNSKRMLLLHFHLSQRAILPAFFRTLVCKLYSYRKRKKCSMLPDRGSITASLPTGLVHPGTTVKPS